MRKQTKLAVVLAAAALLAVGSASLVSATGWVQEGAEWRYVDSEGDYATDVMKKSGDVTFYLDENGYMAKDYFLQSAPSNDGTYYFGANGAMVRNTWVAVDPALVDGSDEDMDVCWLYFQDTGKAYKATGNNETAKKKIDGKTYFFDDNGIMFTGWFDSNGEKYKPDETNDFFAGNTADVYFAGEDGVARSGWLAYTDGLVDTYDAGNDDLSDRATIYFYFNTSNFKLTKGKEKTINGKKYRFNEDGVMYSGWEYLEDTAKDLKLSEEEDFNDARNAGRLTDYWKRANFLKSSISNTKYYSGSDDGHLVKKGWVYAVPSKFIDSSKNNDDEEKYFYFNNNGAMVVGETKKVNGKYYVFDTNGVMTTGLVFLYKGTQFDGLVNLDKTSGAKFIKENLYVDDFFGGDEGPTSLDDNDYSIHYFGSDGARMTGSKIPVEFNDDTYYFASKNSGGYKTKTKKKYYSNGFLLKATDDLKLGLVIASDDMARQEYDALDVNHCATISELTGAAFDLADNLRVVTTTGTEKKKGAYKDGDGNYWLVDSKGRLMGIYTVQVKYHGDKPVENEWKSDAKDDWIKNESNSYNWWATEHVVKGSNGNQKINDSIYDHIVTINNDYCLNFTLQ